MAASEDSLCIRAISLRRRTDRWSACWAHLSTTLPAHLLPRCRIFEGTDAAAATSSAAGGEAAVLSFEQSTDSGVYRGWPLVEVDDARRCYPSTPSDVSDAEAWLTYERACRCAWRPDRARLYIDFFHRHLTAGDVGAALSHLRVAEEAHATGAALTLVLEDDARLTPTAISSLMDEVELLSRLNIEWDMIYLHSADYGRRAEPSVHPSSRLRVAGHRKVCHAYLLSRRGAGKLATSGFRDSLFPIDDFLPALHAGHPREDIMALPCVRRARGESVVYGAGRMQTADTCGGESGSTAWCDAAAAKPAEASDELVNDGLVRAGLANTTAPHISGVLVSSGPVNGDFVSGGLESRGLASNDLAKLSGFIAFTFADDARMLDLPTEAAVSAGSEAAVALRSGAAIAAGSEAAAEVGSAGGGWPLWRRATPDSDSKAGSGSAVLLGDAGVVTDCGEEGMQQGGEGTLQASEGAAHGAGAPSIVGEDGKLTNCVAEGMMHEDWGVARGMEAPPRSQELYWREESVAQFPTAAVALPPAINLPELLLEARLGDGFGKSSLQSECIQSKPASWLRSAVSGGGSSAVNVNGGRSSAVNVNGGGSLSVNGGASSAQLRRQLFERGYARLRMSPSWTFDEKSVGSDDLADLISAEQASLLFFHLPQGLKRRFAGRGGRKGELMLWSCGFSAWPRRQQWHLVCGAFDEAQPWPGAENGKGSGENGSDGGDGSSGGGGGSGGGGNVGGGRDESRIGGSICDGGGSGGREEECAARMRPALRRAERILRGCALACVSASVLGDGGAVQAACAAVAIGEDPSVLDCFLYTPAAPGPPACGAAASTPSATPEAAASALPAAPEPPGSSACGGDRAVPSPPPATREAEMQMSEHFDPGLLTITRTSEIPGLEVWDASIGQWVALEAEAAPNEVLIFAGEQLHALSGGLIPAVRHRVVGSRVAGAERCSVVFELRLLENVAQSVGRPTRGRAVGRPGSQVARVN